MKSIEAIARKEGRRIARKIRLAAKDAYATGDVDRIMVEYDRLLPFMEDLMVVAHLNGTNRSSIMSMGVFDNILKKLERDRSLRIKYKSKAFEIVQRESLKVRQELRSFVNDLLQQGLPTTEGTRLLAEKMDRLGITVNNPYNIETIIRTQNQIAHNAGRWQADQEPEIQEILWGYRYVTVGDDRVREEHMKLDGVTLPKEDPFWRKFWPPNGWGCRCTALPLFEKRKIVKAPPDAKTDPDFAINFGEALR